MITAKRNRSAKLRGVFAALLLALGSITAPLAIAATPSVACSMACCVEAGHCCCQARRASAQNQSSNSTDKLEQSKLFKKCPEGCASLQTSHQVFQVSLKPESISSLNLSPLYPRLWRQIIKLTEFVGSDSPPRAPPVLPSTFSV